MNYIDAALEAAHAEKKAAEAYRRGTQAYNRAAGTTSRLGALAAREARDSGNRTGASQVLDKIAEVTGNSRSHVASRLRVWNMALDLPEAEQEKLLELPQRVLQAHVGECKQPISTAYESIRSSRTQDPDTGEFRWPTLRGYISANGGTPMDTGNGGMNGGMSPAQARTVVDAASRSPETLKALTSAVREATQAQRDEHLRQIQERHGSFQRPGKDPVADADNAANEAHMQLIRESVDIGTNVTKADAALSHALADWQRIGGAGNQQSRDYLTRTLRNIIATATELEALISSGRTEHLTDEDLTRFFKEATQ